jgi:hypothetical protein
MRTGLFGAVVTAQGDSGRVAISTFIAGSARIAQSSDSDNIQSNWVEETQLGEHQVHIILS